MQKAVHSLAAKTTICGFVFVSDVTSQTGGGGEGALTLVTWKLLQSLHNKNRKTTTILLQIEDEERTSIFILRILLLTVRVWRTHLAVLLGHMLDVLFPVCVASVARHTLPPRGGLRPLFLHRLFFAFIRPFLPI